MRRLRLVHTTEANPAMRVKIAFASSDRSRVDQHFGAAESFVLYELTGEGVRLIEVIEFTDADTVMDGHEGKLAGKIALLAGCAAVYCNAVGASAVKQLLAAGIQPIKVAEGEPIDALLCALRYSLTQSPPAWLTKHLKKSATDGATDGESAIDRFVAMAREGWQE